MKIAEIVKKLVGNKFSYIIVVKNLVRIIGFH